MGLILRAISALILPTVVALVVPFLLLNNYPADFLGSIAQMVGILLFVSGLLLSLLCIWLFLYIGRGTIMPWDPTRKLVAVGPYQYVRNPMISGVIAILAGEALFFGSLAIGLLAMVFFLINHVYFIYSEEPGLEKRFGESYREYKRNVPRWIPRLTLKQKD